MWKQNIRPTEQKNISCKKKFEDIINNNNNNNNNTMSTQISLKEKRD
jgi:uridine kinase